METYIYDSTNQHRWLASYRVMGEGNAHLVQIESLSSITVVVGWGVVDWLVSVSIPPYYSYYISVPNLNVATDGYEFLRQTVYLTDALIAKGMPQVEAQTVAQVLRHVADLLESESE